MLFAGTLLPIQLRGPDTVWYDLGYTVFILIVAILVFLYARNQFDLKNEGRVYVAASMQLLLEIVAINEEEFESQEYFQFPTNKEDSDYDSKKVLPNTLLNRADKFRTSSTRLKPTDIQNFVLLHSCYNNHRPSRCQTYFIILDSVP